jgi:deoxyribonuclease-4
MHFGAHESVAGGLHTAFERGAIDACQAMQVFTKNSGMWREPFLSDADVETFREARAAFPGKVMAHTSYLINLATDKPEILDKSMLALIAEVQRCSRLGVDYVVLHPGAHLGFGDDCGIRRVAECLGEVLEQTKDASARILLENTAGQGSCVGHRFEHMQAIFEQTPGGDRLGICFDTQHAFAAGYDLSTRDGYQRTFEEVERLVGLGRIKAFHLNDSKKPLGSRVDRHEHIGEGILGLSTFWRLANDPRFQDVPGVVETEPLKKDGTFYKPEIDLLKSLVGAPEPKPAAQPFTLEVQEAPAKKKRR